MMITLTKFISNHHLLKSNMLLVSSEFDSLKIISTVSVIAIVKSDLKENVFSFFFEIKGYQFYFFSNRNIIPQ